MYFLILVLGQKNRKINTKIIQKITFQLNHILEAKKVLVSDRMNGVTGHNWSQGHNDDDNSGVVVLAHQQVCHHDQLVLRELGLVLLPIILMCPLELL